MPPVQILLTPGLPVGPGPGVLSSRQVRRCGPRRPVKGPGGLRATPQTQPGPGAGHPAVRAPAVHQQGPVGSRHGQRDPQCRLTRQ
ncbi:hypothetical protein BCY76_002550 [Nesterenkonia sp. PF2B19]|nr:hypothetical protein BCY76_002550 [Nesterenkonia sp. PF2B19]